jgi:hypothetical protein
MSIPVTARLGESTVEALDRVADAGMTPNRGAAVGRAVAEWPERHGEDAIVESCRRRYAESGAAADDGLDKVAPFSIATCLADDEH